jgi:hypothetical protein
MKKSLIVAAFGAMALGLGGCDVEQTEEGEMPDVNVTGMPEVNATGGNLPEYDVDAPDVDVKTEERTVEVPTIDVDEADAGKQN